MRSYEQSALCCVGMSLWCCEVEQFEVFCKLIGVICGFDFCLKDDACLVEQVVVSCVLVVESEVYPARPVAV